MANSPAKRDVLWRRRFIGSALLAPGSDGVRARTLSDGCARRRAFRAAFERGAGVLTWRLAPLDCWAERHCGVAAQRWLGSGDLSSGRRRAGVLFLGGTENGRAIFVTKPPRLAPDPSERAPRCRRAGQRLRTSALYFCIHAVQIGVTPRSSRRKRLQTLVRTVLHSWRTPTLSFPRYAAFTQGAMTMGRSSSPRVWVFGALAMTACLSCSSGGSKTSTAGAGGQTAPGSGAAANVPTTGAGASSGSGGTASSSSGGGATASPSSGSGGTAGSAAPNDAGAAQASGGSSSGGAVPEGGGGKGPGNVAPNGGDSGAVLLVGDAGDGEIMVGPTYTPSPDLTLKAGAPAGFTASFT